MDGDILHHLGLSPTRMQETDKTPDALFFYQLILPIHAIDNERVLTVTNDPRKAFYSNVSSWSNLYADSELGILGGGYGHEYQPTNPAEMLQQDGSVVMDGVLDGSRGSFLSRFNKREGNESYHEGISKAFTKTRWLEIKRIYKLCNNLTAKKKKEVGYDPAYKFDYIFDVLHHNVNAVTLFASKDLCLDVTSYAFNGWGRVEQECWLLFLGSLVSRVVDKVMISDVDWIRPRAYVHRHKLHEKHFSLPGPNEVHLRRCCQLESSKRNHTSHAIIISVGTAS